MAYLHPCRAFFADVKRRRCYCWPQTVAHRPGGVQGRRPGLTPACGGLDMLLPPVVCPESPARWLNLYTVVCFFVSINQLLYFFSIYGRRKIPLSKAENTAFESGKTGLLKAVFSAFERHSSELSTPVSE